MAVVKWITCSNLILTTVGAWYNHDGPDMGCNIKATVTNIIRTEQKMQTPNDNPANSKAQP